MIEEDIDNEVLDKEIHFEVIPNEQLRQLCMMMLEKNPDRRANVEDALSYAKKIKKDVDNKWYIITLFGKCKVVY